MAGHEGTGDERMMEGHKNGGLPTSQASHLSPDRLVTQKSTQHCPGVKKGHLGGGGVPGSSPSFSRKRFSKKFRIQQVSSQRPFQFTKH